MPSRLLIGSVLCAVALVVLVGCPDTADTTSPVITLVGSNPLLIPIGGTFTDPGATVIDNDLNYPTTMATPMITDDTDPTGIEIITISTAVAGTYTITYTAPADAAGNTPTAVTRTVRVANPIDGDNDRLIDINTLDDMNAIHNNLDGTSYRASAGGTQLLCGADAATACIGYELLGNLDFDTPASYASGTINADWRPDNTADPDTATNAGWDPIGSCNLDADNDTVPCGDADDDPFTAIFAGNGFTIANLYVRRTGGVGLFGTSSGTIRRIGIVNALLYGDGEGISFDIVGGLAGKNTDTGTITTSYATGRFAGGDATINTVGGLVGENDGTITASYATGDVAGGDLGNTVGGLVGENDGTIITSYATGDADGGGQPDFVGGLVGDNNGTITTSYATGDVDGGASFDTIGGLVGDNDGTITASYATGDADGGAGNDRVGLLAGTNRDGTTVASYGFGTARSRVTSLRTHQDRSDDASLPAAVATACSITQDNSSMTPANRWDPANWDFGTTLERPFVRHNDALVPGQTDRRC